MTEVESLVKLTDLQAKGARDAFRSYDKGDGLKVGNISEAFKKMNQTVGPEFLDKHEQDIDENCTGFITLEEFEVLFRKKLQEEEDEKELREIFRILDKEKRGEVDVKQIRWILKELSDDLSEEDIDDMIAEVDTDSSGWVDYDEFSKLMGSE